MTGIDACRMIEGRIEAAGPSGHVSPHSFRVAKVTDLPEQDALLEDLHRLAGHAGPRDDRSRRKGARNIVERISIRS